MAGKNCDRWPVTSLLFLLAVLVASVLSDSAGEISDGLQDTIHNAQPFFGPFGLVDEFYKRFVKFHFFNRNSTQRTGTKVSLNKDDFLAAGFDANLTTKIIIHGFANGAHSDFVQEVKEAYLEVAPHNVLAVDWSQLSPSPLYLAAVTHMNGVAKRTARLLEFLQAEGLAQREHLHVIGHSLGAHVAGIASKKLKDKADKPGRITALDPARPLLNLNVPSYRVLPEDADLVDAIHTAADTLSLQTATGHVDFYPNGGMKQPGCGADFTGSCSHSRAYLLFAESIRNPTAFPAWWCFDEWDALYNRCEENDWGHTGYMGDSVSFEKSGSYFLKTNASPPFSLSDQVQDAS